MVKLVGKSIIHFTSRIWYQTSNLGNKWSIISDKIVTKDDNSVKNKFYSTIRKGFRKLNKFITNIKRKKIENQIYYHKLLKP